MSQNPARKLKPGTARTPKILRLQWFLAASYNMWRTLYDAYAWFVLEFRSAAEKLCAGDRAAPFPAGSLPPALPFVGG